MADSSVMCLQISFKRPNAIIPLKNPSKFKIQITIHNNDIKIPLDSNIIR